MAPPVFRGTVGLVAVGTRRYIDWFAALERYVRCLRGILVDFSKPSIDMWHYLVGP